MPEPRCRVRRWTTPLLLACAGAAAAAPPAPEAAAPWPEEAASAAPGVETVVVTSRRRVEPAQSVPVPISVISGRDMEVQRLYQVQELPQALPGMGAQFLHTRQSSLAVRGIGGNTANEGLEASVGVYIDNVFLGRPGQAVIDLIDIEQIDLLRGPQGTLFGKNTTAGVLNISSRAPGFQREATLELSVGNRRYHQLRASVSGPVSAQSALRISAYDTHDRGWVRNTVDGGWLNAIGRRGLRAQWLLRPDTGFSLRVIGEHHRESSSTGALVPYAYGPLSRGAANTETHFTTYPQVVARLGASLPADPDAYRTALDGAQRVKTTQNGLSAEANATLGAGFRLTSITAWRDWSFDPANDLDLSPLPGVTGGFRAGQRQFSQELRLASPSGGGVDYVLGAFYYRQDVTSDNRYDTGASALALTGGAYPNNNVLSGHGAAHTRSAALFGQAHWHLTPSFDLGTGLRFTHERKTGHVQQNDLAAPAPAFAVLPVFRAWDSGPLARRDRSVSAMLTASLRVTPTVLGYATLSRGEKSGGFNVNSVASPGSAFGTAAIVVEPEKVDNLDLGIKSLWLAQRLQFNANLFLMKVHGYQAVTNDFYRVPGTSAGVFLGKLTNVGDLTSRGLEFDLKARVSPAWQLSANGAYTVARFDSGTATTPFDVFNGAYGRGAQDITGNTVNGSPRWALNLSAQVRDRLPGGAERYAGAQYAWRAATWGDINNSAHSRIPAYGLLHVGGGLRFAQGEAGGWDVSLWVRNLFDKRHYLGLTTYGSNVYVASAGAPRSFGMTVRREFE